MRTPIAPVVLGHSPPEQAAEKATDAVLGSLVDEAARAARGGPATRLDLVRRWGDRLPLPGQGATARRWEMLATVGAVDLGVARALEPHADALAILAEAGQPPPDAGSTWGVYAAEGPGTRVSAAEHARRWRLDGTKPWCSLAGQVTDALITAWIDQDTRGLFRISLPAGMSSDEASSPRSGQSPGPGVAVEPTTWVARGLRDIVSGPITLIDCPAEPVGGPGWYLSRDGFAWGGIGVAAVWYGATVALARRLWSGTHTRTPDQIALAQLGAADLALTAARTVLAETAAAVDSGHLTGSASTVWAYRARGVVAEAAERILALAAHGLGPAPLTQEEDHARRVADLQVYVRQHHGQRDAAALGQQLHHAAADSPPW